MPDNHVKFHSINGKRLILIVEDEPINREVLGLTLGDVYDIIYAATGAEAVEKVYEYKDILSLVLLDLILPDIHGLKVLSRIRKDPSIGRIPVIVMTADKEAEVESLTIGAIDFIPKPYPKPEVIQARVLRTIELSEDRDIIRSTERDHLTGLYNREFFYRYADQFDTYHKDLSMDAIVLDVNHFHMINERYGRAYADDVLRRIGEKARDMVRDSGGIVCRREADTFLIYCPHRSDYTDILENASSGLAGKGRADSKVRLRMGVYSDVDKTIDIERRFDRAKLACDTVKSNFTRAIAIYDNALHESEIFAEQLLEDFREALVQKQFQVYYQPKFDIRPSEPVLSSAEALVRWKHPELGMISPGIFIPLFEGNGMIQELDSYVWRMAASTMRDWKDRLGFAVPVSVNVSRIDMYDPDLVDNMKNLMEEFGLSPEEFLLEITESAYTKDSEQIIQTVNELREEGFRIEMDDFGTGYSSLNMISTLPIDAMKLDMQFIRNAFNDRKDIRMLEVIIEIADSLSVPTIAEGVETAEQMFTLKAMGCDIVQGYYFSRPLPAEEYEAFLIERKNIADPPAPERALSSRDREGSRNKLHERYTYDVLHDPETGLYNYSGYEMLFHDSDQSHIALLIARVDSLKELADEYGKETGSRLVRHIADVLRQSFRSVDMICRTGKEEFVIIMTRVNSSMKQLVFDKVDSVNEALLHPEDGLPPVSLRVGAAFSDRKDPQGDLLKDADTALGRMKEGQQAGCSFY